MVLPDSMYDRIKAIAAEKGVTATQFIKDCVEKVFQESNGRSVSERLRDVEEKIQELEAEIQDLKNRK